MNKAVVQGTVIEDERSLPVLPLRDVVVYPHMVTPLFVGRHRSIHAVEAAVAASQKIFLLAQTHPEDREPEQDELYRIGTVATVLQLLRLPDGTLKVLVEGGIRAAVVNFEEHKDYLAAEISALDDEPFEDEDHEPLLRSLVAQFDQYVKVNKKIPPEVTSSLSGIDDLSRLADTVAAHLVLKLTHRQKILEITSLQKRVQELIAVMESEIDVLQVEKKIRSRVKQQMEKHHRDFYLNEQMKAIQKELGTGEDGQSDFDVLATKIEQAKMSKEAKNKALSELKKLKNMPPMAAEAAVVRNYIETLINVPWSKRSRVKHDLLAAEARLDEDHYGLDKVKERILEYLAVQQRVGKLKGPILCLVGPPGVGKTSLGESIARATGRNFARIALGGVRDEAEIRGHRRTYVGAMPGRIIQKMTKAKTKNPMVLLDEIDKMAQDFRGDPASALLEVLDPEQNAHFNDHYLEVDYDLSDVMFVATANSMDIPSALLDRMEVIRLSGYTEDEKLAIAKNYLVPKSLQSAGLKKKELSITDTVILDIIRYYTREAGVRSLERELAKLCRKAVRQIVSQQSTAIRIGTKNLADYLGVRKFRYGLADQQDQVGQVTGLAWTEVGGELLKIEASVVPGKGKSLSTGQLGEVMQESIQAAMTVVRAHAKEYQISDDFYEHHDVHIHVPEGATPKDGPSAGIAMCTALISALSERAVRADIAMTGEITLRGEVLPIGGLKEKLLAARRGGVKTVIIPADNARDLTEIPTEITGPLEIHALQWIDDVLALALAKNIK